VNILKLKEFDKDHVVYLYQPEGRGEFGEVLFRFADNTAAVTKRAEENSDWYANKAIFKVKECVKKKNLPMDFIQAWY